MSTARSHLYVPGGKPEVLAKALGRGADALILDLEDAVAPANKDLARTTVAQWLSGLPTAAENPVQVWIRINPGLMGHDDVKAVIGPAVTGAVRVGALRRVARGRRPGAGSGARRRPGRIGHRRCGAH